MTDAGLPATLYVVAMAAAWVLWLPARILVDLGWPYRLPRQPDIDWAAP